MKNQPTPTQVAYLLEAILRFLERTRPVEGAMVQS